MKNPFVTARARNLTVSVGLAIVSTGLGAIAGYALSQGLVSQKGRAFSPNYLEIKRGEVVRIVNDDADLRHHIYISDDKFNYDSGDQEPGTVISIAFSMSGEFEVLCAIHPKMRMVVKVE